MKRTFLFSLALLLVAIFQVRAQQDAQFTQYMFNQLYYNPAFAGPSNGTTLTAIHRSQWFGYDGTVNQGGAPSTQLISYNSNLPQI